MTIETKIKDKSVVVGIIGLGYVGLPLAHSFSNADIKTIGFEKWREACLKKSKYPGIP